MKFYQLVIISYTLIVFLNLLYYFTIIKVINFPSYFVIVAFYGLMILYYENTKKKIYLDKGLLFWVILYTVINTIYYLADGAPGGKEYKLFVPSIVWLFSFITMSLIYNLDNNALLLTRRSIVLSLLIATLLLLYDFTHPGFFTADYISNYYETGRAVATYGNQNIVGAVFILGLILTIDIIPSYLKFPYIIFIFIGILTTVSRSNILIYFIILIIMAIQKKISRTFSVLLILVFILLIFWLLYFGLDILQKDFDINISSDVTDRLKFFTDFEHNAQDHNKERAQVLKAALSMFADHPILGNGFAATRMWEYRVGPHNTFALTWADFGLIGVLIIPTFLFFTTYNVIKNSKKEYRDIGILFIFYFTLSSFFSHNMLEEGFNICGAVIIATLGIKNKVLRNIKDVK